MTIREYITSKFQSFGINVSDADLVDMLNDTNFFSFNSIKVRLERLHAPMRGILIAVSIP